VLRITRVAESPSHVTLRLEGRIVSDWVSVVERECLTWLQEKRQVILGVAEGTFIDRSGLEMLRRIISPQTPDHQRLRAHRGATATRGRGRKCAGRAGLSWR